MNLAITFFFRDREKQQAIRDEVVNANLQETDVGEIP